MTTIRFINGLKEIGGTFIEVETARAKCMFDFGFANALCTDRQIRVRGGQLASDLARLHVLPATDGIYEELTAKRLRVKPYGDSSVGKTCFLIISHMHIDHIGGLFALHPDVPVYMSEDSLRLYRSLEACGQTEHGGHENIIGVPFHEAVTVGDITFTAVPVDHDVIGACGFLIKTKDGSVCYTGDYRFHGYHPEVTRAFADTCRGADVMITEGVTISFEDIDLPSLTAPQENKRTEQVLLEELKEMMRTEQGLLIANPYGRNVERIHHMIQAAKDAGRCFVTDDRVAQHLQTFYPGDEVHVYLPTLSQEARARTLPASWKTVTEEEVLAHPGDYLLQMEYGDLYALTGLAHVCSAYLHTDGAPLGDYDSSYASLLQVLETLRIPHRFMSIGGHAEPYYLRWMADTIAPKVLVPVHTYRPEQFVSEKAGRILLPDTNEELHLPL